MYSYMYCIILNFVCCIATYILYSSSYLRTYIRKYVLLAGLCVCVVLCDIQQCTACIECIGD